MTPRDRSPVYIAFCDLALAILAVVIVAVNPPKAAGIDEKADYLISAEWNVDIDADVDVWLIPPTKKPIFYGSRDVGCGRLDSDNRGFLDDVVRLADGTKTKVRSDKETISLRCVEPGHYDVGVNLYSDHRRDGQGNAPPQAGIAVHVEIVAVNPIVRLVYAKDVILDRVGQTVNVESFDLDRTGAITLSEPPLEAVTAKAYQQYGYPQ